MTGVLVTVNVDIDEHDPLAKKCFKSFCDFDDSPMQESLISENRTDQLGRSTMGDPAGLPLARGWRFHRHARLPL